jgi:hypothetical protein
MKTKLLNLRYLKTLQYLAFARNHFNNNLGRVQALLTVTALSCNFFGISALAHTQHTSMENRLNDHRLIAQGTPAAPTISPTYGNYPSGIESGINISAPAGTIYQTTDGSQPTTSSSTNTGPLGITTNTQVNAIAVVSGVSSPVSTAWYAYDTNAYTFPTSNFSLWLRSDFGPIGSGGNVSAWGDISLSQNTATATSPNQPTLQANSVNNLPAVTFTPGSSGQFMSIPSAVSNFSSGLSMFVVARPSTLTSGAQLVSLGSGTSANSVGLSENSSNQPTFSVYNGGGTATTISGTSAMATNQFQLYEVVQSANTATIYVNGNQLAQNASMNSLPTGAESSSFIGQSTAGGNYFSGQIAEVLIYSTALTQPQRSVIEAYLIQKYQLGLPIQAPIISVPGGTLTAPVRVAIATGSAAETVVFTPDGSTPTTASQVYTSPIDVYYSQTIKAMAINGVNQSTVSSATYTLDSQLYPAPSSGGVPLQFNMSLPSSAIP